MAIYTFDITEKTVDFIYRSVKDMPGNNGQQVLVDRIPETDHGGQVLVTVSVDGNDVAITSTYDLDLKSNHPEAIEIILDTGEQHGELFARAAEVPGPWALEDAIETNNWKVVGYDQ